jgi:Na+/pantothenate symporter
MSSMVAGTAVALAWMAAGKPMGLHGFIPGVLISLVVFVAVSLMTPRPDPALVARAWGEE